MLLFIRHNKRKDIFHFQNHVICHWSMTYVTTMMNRILSPVDFPMILMITQYFLCSQVKIWYSRGILCSSFINFSFSFEKASSFPSPGLAGSVALWRTTVVALVTGGAARRSWWLSLTIFVSGGTSRGRKGERAQKGRPDPTEQVYLRRNTLHAPAHWVGA